LAGAGARVRQKSAPQFINLLDAWALTGHVS
jgi:hypothetical protein